jgi:hypothetical protein
VSETKWGQETAGAQRKKVLARRLCLVAVLGLWALASVAVAQVPPTPPQLEPIHAQQEQLQRPAPRAR